MGVFAAEHDDVFEDAFCQTLSKATNGRIGVQRHKVLTEDGEFWVTLHRLHHRAPREELTEDDGRFNESEASTTGTGEDGASEVDNTPSEVRNTPPTEPGSPMLQVGSSSVPSSPGVVCFFHGLLESSINWIVSGNCSLAVELLDAGHDVWLANSRGTLFSRSVREGEVEDGVCFKRRWSSSDAEREEEGAGSSTCPEGACSSPSAGKRRKRCRCACCQADNCARCGCFGRDVCWRHFPLAPRIASLIFPLLFLVHSLLARILTLCGFTSWPFLGQPSRQEEMSSDSKAWRRDKGPKNNCVWDTLWLMFVSVWDTMVLRLSQFFGAACWRCAAPGSGHCHGLRAACREEDERLHWGKWTLETMGLYDVPAVLRRVASLTGTKRITCIGQSQGAAQLLVYAAACGTEVIRGSPTSTLPLIPPSRLVLFNPPVCLWSRDRQNIAVFGLCALARRALRRTANFIFIARWCLPDRVLADFCDFLVRSCFRFYRSNVSLEARKAIYRYTPNGSTSFVNMWLWVDMMLTGLPLRLPPVPLRHFFELPNANPRRAETSVIPESQKKPVEHTDIEVYEKLPLERIRQVCQVDAYFGLQDNLVHAGHSIAALEHALGHTYLRVLKFPDLGHLDFAWGSERVIDTYPLVKESLATQPVRP